ncbi:MAG: hypothetical protein WAQ52_14525, partial [Terriglobales bacterium]
MYDAATCGYDVVSTQFTGKERDTESGLDNFGARRVPHSFAFFANEWVSSQSDGIQITVNLECLLL